MIIDKGQWEQTELVEVGLDWKFEMEKMESNLKSMFDHVNKMAKICMPRVFLLSVFKMMQKSSRPSRSIKQKHARCWSKYGKRKSMYPVSSNLVG